MCGRTALALDPATILQRTGATCWLHLDGNPSASSSGSRPTTYRPSYNVGPTRIQPVLLRDKVHGLVLQSMVWGMRPKWMASARLLINARDDSLLSGKPTFKRLRDQHRGILVCEGYYEWLRPQQDPFYVTSAEPSKDLLYVAALWTDEAFMRPQKLKESASPSVVTEEVEPLRQYLVITSSSEGAKTVQDASVGDEALMKLEELHDRIPVLLSKEEIEVWLDPERKWDSALEQLVSRASQRILCLNTLNPTENADHILTIYKGKGAVEERQKQEPDQGLAQESFSVMVQIYPVSKWVNKIGHDDVKCIQVQRKDEDLGSSSSTKRPSKPVEKGARKITDFYSPTKRKRNDKD